MGNLNQISDTRPAGNIQHVGCVCAACAQLKTVETVYSNLTLYEQFFFATSIFLLNVSLRSRWVWNTWSKCLSSKNCTEVDKYLMLGPFVTLYLFCYNHLLVKLQVFLLILIAEITVIIVLLVVSKIITGKILVSFII